MVCSWTVITWIVVIGSSLVMIVWIIIYSFFESNDFNDEVTVLFGNVTFWATVVVSVVVSLCKCLTRLRNLFPYSYVSQPPGSS